MNQTKICAGGIRYETELGPLFLDSLVDSDVIDQLVGAMARRKLTPMDIVSAEIKDGDIYFELREPLSSD